MTETIGFIGVGQIGGTLSKLAVKAGYKVVLSNSRGPETLADTVAQLGGESVARADTAKNIAEDKNIKIVVLTVPLKVIPTLVPSLGGLKDKLVIDTNNYYPQRDGHIKELDSRKLTTAEFVVQYLDKSARVAKVFNDLIALHIELLATKEPANQTYITIVGDDADTKEEVSKIVRKLGFATTDAGSFKDSWRIEPNTPVYCFPYFPIFPEGLNKRQKVEFFKKNAAPPLSEDKVQSLVHQATKDSPVGGTFDMFGEIYSEAIPELY